MIGVLSAQQAFRTKTINANYGLSQSFVHALAQDESGFVWAGTQDGLNRFDGYSFKQYRKRNGDTTSLSSNYIWSLHMGIDHLLWVGTTNGVNAYDPKRDQFRRYQIPSSDPKHQVIRTLYTLSPEAILVGTAAGLFLLNPTTASFQQLHSQSATSLDGGIIYSIHPIGNGHLLIGTRVELFDYYPITHKIRPHHTHTSIQGGLKSAEPAAASQL